MANQVAARLKGDDFQHLYAWYLALELIKPGGQVAKVTVEDEKAWSADDVTIEYTHESGLPNRFFQIKHHVNHSSSHSTASFIEHKPGSTSQLQKLFNTWQHLEAQANGRPIEIHFISTWTWDSNDKMREVISAENNAFIELFYNASLKSDLGKLRTRWITHLKLDNQIKTFFKFAESLRLWPGHANWDWMKRIVKERMENLGLKSDETALLLAVGIVRAWIKDGTQLITSDLLNDQISTHDLRLPPDTEPSVHVYLTTIKDQKFDIDPDYLIDWRSYFVGRTNQKGHALGPGFGWNETLLPQLEAMEGTINTNTSHRLIRARGLSRLSAWFAFGATFSEVNRYTIEVDQQGSLWRSDATPSPDFTLVDTTSVHGEIISGSGSTVAVGIEVTGSLVHEVKEDFAIRGEQVAALLILRPNRELGADCIRGAGDAVALALGAKEAMRNFVRHWRAKRLLLYYFGPLSGACFIGHRLNAICQEIQIMENQQPGYEPSFLL